MFIKYLLGLMDLTQSKLDDVFSTMGIVNHSMILCLVGVHNLLLVFIKVTF